MAACWTIYGRKNPDLFRKGGFPSDRDLMDLYKTTLLAETLNIDETTLEQYKDKLLAFWKEVPERSYGDEL